MSHRPIHRRLITPPFVVPSKNFGVLPDPALWTEKEIETDPAPKTRQEEFPDLPAKIVPGMEIGGFRIIEPIGSGGTAAIYRALQRSSDREIALKVLSPHLAPIQAAVERFHREAELPARFDHPGIIPIYRRGVDLGYHYYAMKLMRGPTLAEFIDKAEGTRGEALFRDAALLFASLCRTVAAVHSRDLIHQDIKPTNLFLANDSNRNRLVLTDFGVAADLSRPEFMEAADISIAPKGEALLLGTPAYMAPERFIQGKQNPDPRSDVYSLGLCLYELVTGVLPFPACGDEEMARLKLAQKPPSPRSVLATVPLGLEAIIRQAIESHILLRYQTAVEMALDLERFAQNRRSNTRKHRGPEAPFLNPPPPDEEDIDGAGEFALI
ncbi:MAG: serine/threonine protein kinase [Planctomycetes bacterium]|nr:serine/threonine protein kinase [Planctomycetota bacterium]